MSNPFNVLNQANPYNSNNMANIRNAYDILIRSKNPNQVFEQMAMRNPSLQPAVQMLRSGLSPQQVFTTMCNQKGINPQEFLRNITGK